MSGGGNRVLVELNREQLQQLAVAVRAQEIVNLKKINFRSHQEQLQYLNSCNESFNTIEDLLERMERLQSEMDDPATHEEKKSIAHDVFEYTRIGVSTSLELIQSYHARKTHLGKLKDHCDGLVSRLHALDPITEIGKANDLALEALNYRRAALDHAKKMQSFLPNQFTKWIKERNLQFEELLKHFQVKLNLNKPFKQLTDIEKLKVYESIIEAAGRGKSVVNYGIKAMGAIGAAVLVFTAGSLVWDIFTAEDKIETIVRGMTDLFLSAISLSTLSASAIESGLALVGIKVAGAALTAAGTVVGFGIVVLIGVGVGALLDLIFNSGSTDVLSTENLSQNVYLSPMPDGIQLAHIIKANNP